MSSSSSEAQDKKKEQEPELTANQTNASYETAASVNQYLEFHFTPTQESLAPRQLANISDAYDFPIRLGELLSKRFHPKQFFGSSSSSKTWRALDLGCATGASVFELSTAYDEVIGVDLSNALIAAANRVKALASEPAETTTAEVALQGNVTLSRTIHRRPANANPERTTFLVGDALDTQTPSIGQFDAVMLVNLIDRVPDPRALLSSLPERLRIVEAEDGGEQKKKPTRQGVVLIATPFSWHAGATPEDKWLGGSSKYNTGSSEEALKSIMSNELGFTLLDEADEPFIIRDHARRFQFTFAHRTVWKIG